MKILHLSTTDGGGGAARAAFRLHTGLLRKGHDSRMLVLKRVSGTDQVTPVTFHDDFLTRIRRGGIRKRIARDFAKYKATLAPGYESFSDDRSETRYDFKRSIDPLLPVDIINLHWVAGLLDHTEFFADLPSNIPLVWRLADMGPLTGGCHYDDGCGKFSARCGACPILGSKVEDDLSRQIWTRKHAALASIPNDRLHVVGTSQWIASQAEKSSLLGRFPRTVIPNGLDTSIFSPRNKAAVRDVLGVPTSAKVVLFVAESSKVPRKGFDHLAAALKSLAGTPNLFLLSVGGGQSNVPGIPQLHLGRLSNDRFLSMAYSAADVFVIPSLQESFGQTVTESMACGTPVVGFDAGGIPDMVRPGVTGYLAPVGDSAELAKQIRRVLDDVEGWPALSANCRKIAVDEYSLNVQASSYAAFYKTLIPANGG